MERKIGEIFEVGGQWYQCVQGNCEVCAFSRDEHTCLLGVSNCVKCRKNNDCKAVAFKKLEKVGEPFYSELYHSWFQKYKLYEYPECHFGADYVLLEIKQNKEDMEENMEEEREYTEEEFKNNPRFQHHKNIEQIINMKKLKEFDINLAKQGKPVCTRDGRKARIICFDCKDETFKIVALVSNSLGKEEIISYDEAGYSTTRNSDEILMMFPEKKEGWANVYDDTPIYDTKEEALNRRSEIRGYIDTVKVSWEE